MCSRGARKPTIPTPPQPAPHLPSFRPANIRACRPPDHLVIFPPDDAPARSRRTRGGSQGARDHSSNSSELGVAPRDRNWIGRLKDWVGCGKKILVAPGDGAALAAHYRQLDFRPTRKEASMSADPKPADFLRTDAARTGATGAESKPQVRVHIRWM